MSPVFILSRLCLKRRFQFFGMSVPPDVRYLTTFLTASSSITFRSPTSSAFSAGTLTVMSLCRILMIKILHKDMTVNVPAENAELVGLRKVIDEEAVKKVVKYLTSGGTDMPKNWNRRFKHNRDKMKTGDIYELAEVVRNLALRDGEKGLSTGEKQMYVKAKKILASELMYAKNMSEDEALEWLEETLTEGAKPKATPAEKKAAAPKKATAAPAAK